MSGNRWQPYQFERRWKPPLLTPQQKDEIRQKADALRQEDPAISHSEISRRLATEYGVSAACVRYLTA